GTIAAHALALRVHDGRLWGADAYAFLAPGTLIAALAAAAAMGWRAARRAARGDTAVRRPLAGLAALVAFGGLFWLLRIRHVLLGDGIPISNLLPSEHGIHPREPLAMALQHVWYRLLAPIFAARDGA